VGNQGGAGVKGCKGKTERAVAVREKYDDAVNNTGWEIEYSAKKY
jgi:hypothetical protein